MKWEQGWLIEIASTYFTVEDALLQVVGVNRDSCVGLDALVVALVGAGAVLVGRVARGDSRPLVLDGDRHCRSQANQALDRKTFQYLSFKTPTHQSNCSPHCTPEMWTGIVFFLHGVPFYRHHLISGALIYTVILCHIQNVMKSLIKPDGNKVN